MHRAACCACPARARQRSGTLPPPCRAQVAPAAWLCKIAGWRAAGMVRFPLSDFAADNRCAGSRGVPVGYRCMPGIGKARASRIEIVVAQGFAGSSAAYAVRRMAEMVGFCHRSLPDGNAVAAWQFG